MEHKKITAPITWFGGKSNLTHHLIPLFPNHRVYVEPFGGAGNVLLCKPESEVEIYNDFNTDLVNFYRAMKDEKSFSYLYSKSIFCPFAREQFNICRDELKTDDDVLERAYKWYVMSRLGFGGSANAWGFITNTTTKNMAQTCSGLIASLSRLPQVHNRFKNVIIENDDGLKVIQKYDCDDALIYADPPYPPETRAAGTYDHELSTDDHNRLLDVLLSCKGKVVISSYPSDLYNRRLKDEAGWDTKTFQTSCMAVGRTKQSGRKGTGNVKESFARTEIIYANYKLTKSSEVSLFGDD